MHEKRADNQKIKQAITRQAIKMTAHVGKMAGKQETGHQQRQKSSARAKKPQMQQLHHLTLDYNMKENLGDCLGVFPGLDL